MNKSTKVINLFAGPGAGKSTTAAGIFYLLKTQGIKCELVTEYAKDLVYENRDLSDNGLLIFAQQHRRMHRLLNKVEFIITDSPILMSVVYQFKISTSFNLLATELFNNFNNINIFVNRVKKYEKYGRVQEEEEARNLDIAIKSIIPKIDLLVDGDREAPDKVVNYILDGVTY